MIFFTRTGFWALLLPLLSFLAGMVLIPLIGLDAMGIGVLAGAVALWFLGRRLNGPACERIWLDPKIGKEVVVRDRHTMCWIAMEWWAIPWAIVGIAMIVAVTVHHA
jgi:hypothetical protein